MLPVCQLSYAAACCLRAGQGSNLRPPASETGVLSV
jgi:hypothetical protein